MLRWWRTAVTILYIGERGVVLLRGATVVGSQVIAAYPINSRADELLDIFRIHIAVVDITAIRTPAGNWIGW
jgi:hypothetical protein